MAGWWEVGGGGGGVPCMAGSPLSTQHGGNTMKGLGEKYKVDPLHAYKLLHFEVLNFTGYINHTNQN